MIFYFSGTGNSAWAARQLARLTDDEAYDIISLKEQPNIDHAKQIGFVFPVYAWGAPEVVVEFAKKAAQDPSLHLRRVHLRRGCRTCHEAVFQAVSAQQQL